MPIAGYIEIEPRERPQGKSYYLYDVYYNGALILEGSRDPEHEAWRVSPLTAVSGIWEVRDRRTGKARSFVDGCKARGYSALDDDKRGLRLSKWKPFGPL